MGQAGARGRAPGCGAKGEGRKEADENEALRPSCGAVEVLIYDTYSSAASNLLSRLRPLPFVPRHRQTITPFHGYRAEYLSTQWCDVFMGTGTAHCSKSL